MILAWLVLLPSGIFIATFFRTASPVENSGGWFTWHVRLNSVGLVLSIAGGSIAFASLEQHLDTPHKIVGTLVLLLSIIQPMNAAVRPAHGGKKNVDGPSTKARRVWEAVHKFVGRLTGVLAFVNVVLGASAVHFTYAGNVTVVAACIVLFVVVTCLLIFERCSRGSFSHSKVEAEEM
jgi:hypothetical protein